MAVERRGAARRTVVVECSFCGTALREGQGLADHLPNCDAHPLGTGGDA